MALLGSVADSRAANVLINPGIETGDLTGWTKYGVFDINTTNNVYYNGCNCGSNVWVYDGLYIGKTYGQFTGGENFNGVFQDVSAAPTSVLSADAWIYTSTQDRIGGGNTAWIEVHFLDAVNNTIALYQSTPIDPTTTPDTWMNYPVTNQVSPVTGTVANLVAPAGTVKVRYQIVFHQPAGFDGGSVFWDDCNLNLISGPIPPSIGNIKPSGTILLQGTNTFGFTASASSSITNIQLVLNGTDVSGSLVTSGSASSKGVTYPGLQTNKIYTAAITVTDANGLVATASVSFDTFNPNNFTWEAEDWDFNGGQSFDNPALPSTASPPTNSYYGQQGVSGVDYLDTSGDGTHVYRGLDFMATEVTSDLPRQKYLDAQAGDPSIKDYDVGWFNPTEWINFTRTYPTGIFNIYARMSSPGSSSLSLATVTNGWGTGSQQIQNLGTFNLTGGLGWGTYSWVPMTDDAGNLAKITLGGTNTLRVTTAGNNNAQFFMLVTANTNLPTITGVYPNGATLLEYTNTLAFAANSSAGINPGSISITLGVTNALLHFSTNLTSTNGLVIGGTANARTVMYPGLTSNTLYTAVFHVTDINNNSIATTVKFDTYKPLFMFEAEDWDYGGGFSIDNPPIDAYMGLSGIEGIDFHDVNGSGPRPYRPDTMSADIAGDVPRQNYLDAATNDYAVGFFSPPEWVNYTRTIPSGSYNLYGRIAAGGTTSFVNVSRVTNGWGTASQAVDSLGNFTIANTGGWGTYAWVPLRDAFGNLVSVSLAGTNTLRFTRTAGGDANVNFYMMLPARTDLPSITGVYPNAFMQSTNRLAFRVSDATYGVSTNNIHVTLNGVDISSNLVFTGSSSSWGVTFGGNLAPNTTYTAIITVTDNNGTVATTTVTFDTFSATAFTWEAEDWDHDSGQFFDNPQTNAYAGFPGVEGIDFHDTANGGTDTYRAPNSDATEVATDSILRPQFSSGGTDYDVGFTAGGEWENYTRTYPTGAFNVYARLARGAGGNATMGMSRVTGGWGTATQTTSSLGSFSLGFTGGWQTYNWVPLKDGSGNLATVRLSGTNTLRFTDGGANLNFFTLTPALVLDVAKSGNNVLLSFGTQPGFNYAIQYKTNLTDVTWLALTNVAGDGSVKTVSDPATAVRRFYRMQVQ